MKTRWVLHILPPLLTFIVVTLLAELLVRVSGVSNLVLPRPSAVALAAWSERADLGPALLSTTEAVLLGLVLSAVGGLLLAVLLSASKWVQRAFYPYAIFFQIVPIVAIAPLLVIWLGYGIRTVTAAAFIVSIFPVIANSLAGLLSVDPALRDLFKLYGAGPLATLWKLKLPAALPQILTGLRIAAGLAVIGAIVGEFVGGVGLGVEVQTAMREQRTDIVFAGVLYAAGLGLALFALVSLAGHLALRRWHASAPGV